MVLNMVVVDFAIVVLVDDDLGFSELDDPHAVNKPIPSIDTQRIPVANFCPLFTSCSFLADQFRKTLSHPRISCSDRVPRIEHALQSFRMQPSAGPIENA